MKLHHKHLRHFFQQPQDGVGLVRREMLRVGSAGLFGLSLPHLIAAEAQKVASVKAKNFILPATAPDTSAGDTTANII